LIVALTGRPGVGKTTLFFNVVEELKKEGVIVYGFYCPEVRVSGHRVGFKIVDIRSGKSAWLAIVREFIEHCRMTINLTNKRVGKYIVVRDAESVGIEALKKPEYGKALLAIDEIGPMELSLPRLRQSIITALEKANTAIVVIHRNLNDQAVLRILNEKRAEIITVTEQNRAFLRDKIVKLLRKDM